VVVLIVNRGPSDSTFAESVYTIQCAGGAVFSSRVR
jgi:hypothetical protein